MSTRTTLLTEIRDRATQALAIQEQGSSTKDRQAGTAMPKVYEQADLIKGDCGRLEEVLAERAGEISTDAQYALKIMVGSIKGEAAKIAQLSEDWGSSVITGDTEVEPDITG